MVLTVTQALVDLDTRWQGLFRAADYRPYDRAGSCEDDQGMDDENDGDLVEFESRE